MEIKASFNPLDVPLLEQEMITNLKYSTESKNDLLGYRMFMNVPSYVDVSVYIVDTFDLLFS